MVEHLVYTEGVRSSSLLPRNFSGIAHNRVQLMFNTRGKLGSQENMLENLILLSVSRVCPEVFLLMCNPA